MSALVLTTGTFNLIVKDRTAFRLSGAYSVQNRSAWRMGVSPVNQTQICLSSKPYKVTVRAQSSQPAAITGFPPDLHNPGTMGRRQFARKKARNRTRLPLGSSARFSARADAEDSKLKKELLEVLAICQTSRSDLPNPSRSAVPESGPVAGANYLSF
jgi:hypothetical protein